MSINVVVSSTAAGVSVSGSTSVSITVGGGIGPAGFIVAPGTATNAFGTFQLAAGDGITISTSASQFQIASYGTAAVSSLAPVQSVAGRVGSVQLQASDVTAGTFAIARIPTISYTALANVPTSFGPSAHTHSTSDVVSFTSAAAAAAPVQSVAGRTGAISLAAADVSGLASVATSGSYTSLQNVPATFAPVAHTHGTADITGISSSFAAASHTHEASAIASGVLDLARIPTIGYTALSGVPTTFAPQAHTHGTADVVGLTASFSQVGHTHDYAASIHTHSTADIAGYTSLPAQGGKAGPLVTDGTAASWSTRYSVVDPVLVQGAGMTLSRDTAAGSITVAFAGGTSGIVVSSATPQPLGTAAAGASGDASRADHVHVMPSAADVGAAPASHSHEYVQVLNGLTGTVSITGGAGVTVSTASSSITIAAGGGGSGEDAVLRALFVPPAPTSLTATVGNAQVSLSWAAPSATYIPPITDYVVEFKTAAASTWGIFADGTSTATSATVTGLTNGTAYVFRVAAVNGAGTGAYSSASSSVTPISGDPYFGQVALLLHADGTGNTFVDSSQTPKVITAFGGATQSAAQSKWGGKSAFFDGSGDHLTVPGSASLELGGLDFVVEMWMRTTQATGYATLVCRGVGNFTSGAWTLLLNNGTTGNVAVFASDYSSSQALVSTSGANVSDGEWHHVAWVRSGSTHSIYIDGTRRAERSGSAFVFNSSENAIAIGNDLVFTGRNYDGHIDDLRMTIGSSRGYSGGSIPVPTAAFPDA